MLSNWLLEGINLGRLDMTDGKLYTVSEASKRILKSLKAPVTTKLYISHQEKMPTGMKSLEQDITDKLDELRIASGGKLTYKVFHMEAARLGGQESEDISLEESLQRKGIQPFQVRSIEADEVGVTLIYSAMSVAYKEKAEEVIPRIHPQNLAELEYLLLSKIYRLTIDKQPRVALFAPFSERRIDPQIRMLMAQLGQNLPDQVIDDDYAIVVQGLQYEGYQVDRITLTEDDLIPEDVDTLVVIAPEDLNERQQYEIGRFLRGGGSILIAAQNYNYTYDPSGGRGIQLNPVENRHNLNPLLETWGLTLSKDFLMDEENEVLSISGGASLGPFALSVPVRVPVHILIKGESMNHEVSITSHLSSLFYLWGSSLILDEEKMAADELTVTRLLSSSKRSWEVPFHSGPLTTTDIDRSRFESDGPFPLAVLVEGQFADSFEGESVPAWPQQVITLEDAELEDVVKDDRPLTPKPGKLILVGDATFLTKDFIQSGGHLAFLVNSVDALTLGEDLIEIRSKRPIDRSIPRVPAGLKATWRVITTVVPAAFFALIWFCRALWRRSSKQKYLKVLAAS